MLKNIAFEQRSAMNIQHLEEFLVLARELNYSAAAQRSYIARATLVEHIADLEKELGCNLFSKENGHLTLTPIGRRFVSTASQLTADVRAIVEEYCGLAGNFLSVRIAATNLPWIETSLPHARRAVQESHPEKVIEIMSVPGAASTVNALLDGSNDIVVAGRKRWREKEGIGERLLDQGIEGFLIQTEAIKFLVTEGNPLFAREHVTARDLDGTTLVAPPDIYEAYVRDGVVEHFAQKGARVALAPLALGDHFEYFNSDFDRQVGVVPSTLEPRFGIDCREECRTFNLDDLDFVTDFYLLYRITFLQDETARLLIDEMKREATS